MFEFLKKILNKSHKPREMETRLTKEQVLVIARNSDVPDDFKDEFCSATAKLLNDRILWEVSSHIIGAQYLVFVDDATSKITEIKKVGVR